MHPRQLLALAVVAVGLAAPCAARAADAGAPAPIVIAHRGASGYLPEHTLGGYELAMRMGADYVEPDLQLTRDGVLVAMHDDTLERTTNAAELLAPRNGGYKVADFTLAEIKTLTVRPTRSASAGYPGFVPTAADPWRVPTLQEVIDLVKGTSAAMGRGAGIYPEAKQADPAMEDAILKILARNGYDAARGKVFIQSFSDATLRSLRAKQLAQGGAAMPLMQLGVAAMDAGGKAYVGVYAPPSKAVTLLPLQEVARYAAGVGVAIGKKAYPVTPQFVAQAHAAGLKVHGWTFAKADAAQAADEYRKYLAMGMDGMFSNYPDLAAQARDAFVRAGR